MDTQVTEQYRTIVTQIITKYAQFQPAIGDIECEIVIDEQRDHYELLHVGWKHNRRVHGSVIHVDIKDDKIWIQHDGTESGIAPELVAAGVPPDKIVLAWHEPEIRKHTAYAIA
jgi:ketopantoate reductase